MQKYNSALEGFDTFNKDGGALPISDFKESGIHAFVHDLSLGLADEHKESDCIYTDPPWRSGYNAFHAKAGIEPKITWAQLMLKMNAEYIEYGKPVYLLGGKDMFRYFCLDYEVEIYSVAHKQKLRLGIMNERKVKGKTNHDVIGNLARTHSSICDPSCGGGLVGFIAKRNNCKSILSDINPYCIGYIKQEYKNW